MTRLLVWNINNFSLAKVGNSPEGRSRRHYILQQVVRPQIPHIFVVIEVYARTTEVGREGVPVAGWARLGTRQLLTSLRVVTQNPAWMQVPALWSGSFGFCEGIAVYYDSQHLQFAGPYVYGPDYRLPLAHTPPINRGCPLAATVRPAGANPAWLTGAQPYDPFFAGWLPQRALPAGLNLPAENHLAGKYEFFAGANRIYFPSAFNRSPFQTNFIELAAPTRTIKLFSVHTSPAAAPAAVQRLATIPDIVPQQGEVSVIAGDFNVDTFVNRATYSGLTAIAPAGAQFTLAFDSMNGQQVRANRLAYCLTHLLPTAQATPYGMAGGGQASPTQNVYPRFGYMGSMGGIAWQAPGDTGAIDNVLTRYGGGTVPGAAANATVVNCVVGKPYNQTPAPAWVSPQLTGGPAYAQRLANPIPQPAGENPHAANAAAALATFRQWNNFDRLRSTSDHLPIAIDL